MSYSSINRVVLIGNLTQDPELRELPSGHSVCNLRIACNGIRRDAEGEYSERPLYFDVATFGGLAENVARYMHRGSLVAVDGRLEWREWETTDRSESGPQKRQAVSVVAETVQFLDKPATRGQGDRSGETLASGEHPPFGQQSEPGSEDDERELVGAGAGAGEIDLVF
jgi:single-strand DNA-binding protein